MSRAPRATRDEQSHAQRIRIRFQGNPDDETLTIVGDLRKGTSVRVRIEVPRKTSLRVDMSAGEVKVEEIAGDKDIDLYAGRIAISSTRPWDYGAVDVSVSIGEVKAPVYGTEKERVLPRHYERDRRRRVFAACARDSRRNRSSGQFGRRHHRLARQSSSRSATVIRVDASAAYDQRTRCCPSYQDPCLPPYHQTSPSPTVS